MQTLNEHLNEGGTIYSYIEQERNSTNKWFKFWITLVVALSVIFLAVQTEIIYKQNKSISYLKHQNSTDSATNYNNELNMSGTCKSVTASEKQAIIDSVRKYYTFDILHSGNERNKELARRNWSKKDHQYNSGK